MEFPNEYFVREFFFISRKILIFDYKTNNMKELLEINQNINDQNELIEKQMNLVLKLIYGVMALVVAAMITLTYIFLF